MKSDVKEIIVNTLWILFSIPLSLFLLFIYWWTHRHDNDNQWSLD
jgi:hypothetical protein